MLLRRLLLRSAGLLTALAVLATAPIAALAQQATPVPGDATVFELPGDNVFPEGVAYDPDTNTFFVGSTADGTIFQGDLATGEVTTFASGGEVTSAIGMKVDGNGHLIVAGGASGNVYVLDAASGEVLATFGNGLGEGETFLNDVAVAPNGDLYITDSANPVLYRIAAADLENGGDLEAFVEFNGTAFQYSAEGGPNANGIVIDPNGEFAIVVQSGTGNLYRIGLSDGSVAQIAINGENVTFGDGLWLYGQTLYVVRNRLGVIARLQLDEGLTTADVLDSFTDPTLAFPTTIAKVDEQLLVVNSQFDRRESGPVLPFTVSLIDIPPFPTSGTPEATPVA